MSWLIENGEKNNIIVYNLVENSDREAEKRSSQICVKFFLKSFQPIKLENNDRHRPVLVVLQDESDKAFLLTNSSKLCQHDSYKSVYLSPDRTKFE